MKKVILLLALACLPLLAANAQGIGVGLKGGLNFANQDIATVPEDINARTGFHAGVYAHISLGAIGIQPEILYSSQGSEFEQTVTGTNGQNTFSIKNKLAYLNVPVLVRFNIAMFNIHVGPQFGFLASADLDVNDVANDVKDQYKSGDFSIAAGVGVNLPLNLNATVRYVAGLSDIGNEPDTLGEVKNATLQISVGYRLFGNK